MKLLLLFLWSLLSLASYAQDKPATTLTPTEFKQQVKKEKGVVLDVRTQEEFTQGHLKKAQNIDYRNGDFAKNLDQLDKTKTYYLYCASGNRSGKALQLMQEAGFIKVYNIGGFEALKTAGIKLEGQKKK